MSEPDPPLPLRGHRTPPPPRDPRYTRSILLAGLLIGALGLVAVTALLLSAWSLAATDSSHSVAPLHTSTTHPATQSASR